MGRREQPLDPDRGPLARFAHDLRELRRQAGSPPYRQLAARAHYSASTLAEATAGHRLPSAAVLAAFVNACGGDPEEWERRRIDTHRLVTAPAQAPAPVVPALPSPVPPGPTARRRRAAGLVLRASLLTLGAFAAGDTRPRNAAAPGSDGTRSAAAELAATDPRLPDDGRWLRADSDVPERYRALIVEAGTTCHVPQVTPVLVAAMLRAESGFDPGLSDPAKDEYGIARWTPRVLRYYLPPDRQHTVPKPPFTPEDSIPAMGRMLCALAPELEGVPGDPALNLAAAYRTATWIVQRQGPELDRVRPYLEQVRTAMLDYAPGSPPPPAVAAPGGR
ncbi:helix-turn-helix domain-containing protein [Streptomyces sp. NPDC059650]|uniref:helix-turn-helix domain-containing protein n=1 Tax=Streptomyces sp. NPDC059650 TaxID=3346896 RepID=UPI0036BFD928